MKIENANKERLIERLERNIEYVILSDQDMDRVSWPMQEGILISYNEAKLVIESLKSLNVK